MTLTERLSEYVRACFSGLWLESNEHEDALTEIAQLCRQENWQLAVWDIERSLTVPGQAAESEAGGTDPLAAIRSLPAMASAKAGSRRLRRSPRAPCSSPAAPIRSSAPGACCSCRRQAAVRATAVVPKARIPVSKGYQVPFARRIRDEAGILTGAVGLITEARHANEIVTGGDADLVFIARELLRKPCWALKAEQELGVEPAWPTPYRYAVKRHAK
jgi:hypothetical protein